MRALVGRLDRLAQALPAPSAYDEDAEIAALAAARGVSPAVIRAKRAVFHQELAIYDPTWSLGLKVLAWGAARGIPVEELRAAVRARLAECQDRHWSRGRR